MPMIIVGNKLDLEQDRQVETEEAARFAELCGALYMEISAKSQENVDNLFNTIALMTIKQSLSCPKGR
jgi:GTPase SAR1 family protein